MGDPGDFFWLTGQALAGWIYAWPVTLGSLVLIGVAGLNAARRESLTSRNLAWSISPVLVPLMLLAWGAAFRGAGAEQGLSWRDHAILALLALQLPVFVLAVCRARDARLFAASVSAAITHFSFWAAFLAGMSVADDRI